MKEWKLGSGGRVLLRAASVLAVSLSPTDTRRFDVYIEGNIKFQVEGNITIFKEWLNTEAV